MHRLWIAVPLVLLGLVSAPRSESAPGQPGAHDWPQWQGQRRDGVARETGLLKSWPKDGPSLAWKAKGLGKGYSTPSVAAGRVFLTSYRDKNEVVIALDERDGKELWAASIGPAQDIAYTGSRSTPTVDGDRIYALGVAGRLACLNVADGKELWHKELRGKDSFQGSPGHWGYTESPLIDGAKVVVTPGGKKNTLVALDKNDGKLIWSCSVPRGDKAGYSSIIRAEIAGQPQYVQFLGSGVVGVEADSGKYLWRYDHPANGTANISTPLVYKDHVFAASAYSRGGGLAKITCDGSKCEADEVYFTQDMQNHHGGMVRIGDYLYGSNGGELLCIHFLTGKLAWRNSEPGKGSIACADGMLYFRNERGKGTVFLIEANPTKYVKQGRFDQPERSRANSWAHPVIANGRLYIADQDVLLVYDVKQK